MGRIVDPAGVEAATLDRLVDFRGMDVIDLGCGDGRTSRHLARTARSVLGIDPDAEAIAQARASSTGGAPVFEIADAVSFDRPEGSLDAVVCTRSL